MPPSRRSKTRTPPVAPEDSAWIVDPKAGKRALASVRKRLVTLLNALQDADQDPDNAHRARLPQARNIVFATGWALRDVRPEAEKMLHAAELAAVNYLANHPDQHARDGLMPADFSHLQEHRLTEEKIRFLQWCAASLEDTLGPNKAATARTEREKFSPSRIRRLKAQRREGGTRTKEQDQAREIARSVALYVKHSDGLARQLRRPTREDLRTLSLVVEDYLKHSIAWPLEIAKVAAHILGQKDLRHFFAPYIVQQARIPD